MTARWLIDQIALRRRQAVTTTCGRCRHPVLAGLNDDVAAVGVAVDAPPISATAAALAHATGAPSATDGSVVHTVIHGELHRLDGYGIATAIRHHRPLHLIHACPQARAS